jgi:hypothetical protein
MELLIPGLILVALMVWASTKIKKTAAEAYSEETVSTGGFTLVKPEGFIIPVNDDPAILFEARSREYETVASGSLPAASVTVENSGGMAFDDACISIKSKADRILEEDVHREGSRVSMITAEESEDSVSYVTTYKVIEAAENVLILRARTLPEQSVELGQKVEAMVRSFSAN